MGIKEIIGVHPKIILTSSELKKLYLIFNKICILTEEKHIYGFKTLHNRFGRMSPDYVQFLDEFDYLKEQGIIFTASVESIANAELGKDYSLLKLNLNENVTKWNSQIVTIENLSVNQKKLSKQKHRIGERG